jgi:hypothetical protein
MKTHNEKFILNNLRPELSRTHHALELVPDLYLLPIVWHKQVQPEKNKPDVFNKRIPAVLTIKKHTIDAPENSPQKCSSQNKKKT